MTRLRSFGATAKQARLRASGASARRARLRLLLLVVALGFAARPAAAQTEIVEYYGHDALGSIRIVFTASGVATAGADYEPFGEAVTIAGMPTGPLPAQQFTGQERDGLESQDYFGARYYRPRHGRFSQVDPVYAGLFDPQQWNRYAYARNNPLSFVDPDGRQTQGLCAGRPCFQTGIVWITPGPVSTPPPGALASGGDPGFLMGSYLGNVWEHDIGDSPGSYYVPPVLQGLTTETTTDPTTTATTTTVATTNTTTGPTTTESSGGIAVESPKPRPTIAAHKTPFLEKVGTCTMETLGIREPYLYLLAAGGMPVPKVLVGFPRAGGSSASAFTSPWSAMGAHLFPHSQFPGGAAFAGTTRVFGAAGRVSQILGAALLVRDAIDIGSCVSEW